MTGVALLLLDEELAVGEGFRRLVLCRLHVLHRLLLGDIVLVHLGLGVGVGADELMLLPTRTLAHLQKHGKDVVIVHFNNIVILVEGEGHLLTELLLHNGAELLEGHGGGGVDELGAALVAFLAVHSDLSLIALCQQQFGVVLLPVEGGVLTKAVVNFHWRGVQNLFYKLINRVALLRGHTSVLGYHVLPLGINMTRRVRVGGFGGLLRGPLLLGTRSGSSRRRRRGSSTPLARRAGRLRLLYHGPDFLIRRRLLGEVRAEGFYGYFRGHIRLLAQQLDDGVLLGAREALEGELTAAVDEGDLL
ncbi:hypothetical protein AGDE_01877 [Angomonas deanei]|nr:hypothetical protein AGDE_01877 [Angomonas deanei]|eukprot:EPY42046.1 hypothetical protein AGDE_01877 [Angomonas deanei]